MVLGVMGGKLSTEAAVKKQQTRRDTRVCMCQSVLVVHACQAVEHSMMLLHANTCGWDAAMLA